MTITKQTIQMLNRLWSLILCVQPCITLDRFASFFDWELNTTRERSLKVFKFKVKWVDFYRENPDKAGFSS